MVMDSGGDLLFVANQTSNNISVYSVSASDGTLTEIAGSPFPRGPAGSAGFVPSGKFLYVASANLPLCLAIPWLREPGSGVGSGIAVYG